MLPSSLIAISNPLSPFWFVGTLPATTTPLPHAAMPRSSEPASVDTALLYSAQVWHVPLVQKALGPQGKPSLAASFRQPVLAQVSTVQTLWSLQSCSAGVTHLPAWQVLAGCKDRAVQRPSAQLEPSVTAAFTQPLAGSHASAVQVFRSLQFRGAPPMHLPVLQASWVVQALLASQARLFSVKTQPLTVSQLSVVQGLLSLQSSAAPATQLPLLQASGSVQALPSLQGAALAVKVQPVLGSQASSVQALPSLQGMAVPAQVPLAHASLSVHALSSLQTSEFAVFRQPCVERLLGWCLCGGRPSPENPRTGTPM
jgi:hypothetical protein